MVDRLSVLDASFLKMETRAQHLHVGGVGILAAGVDYAAVSAVIRERLDLIPLARRKVLRPPPGGGRLLWVDDPEFDLAYHVRHAALPAPGDRGQLAEFCARLMGRPLDRDRPLWELYLVEGLEGGRTAVFRKAHLAMDSGLAPTADPGVAAAGMTDLFAALLDDRAGSPTVGEGRWPERWRPEPPPGPTALLVDAARQRLEQVASFGRDVVGTAVDRRRLLNAAGDAFGFAASVVGRVARHAPASPLNRPLSAHRRFATARCSLEDLRLVRRAFGGNINDGVVAVVADAVGRLLRWRGHETKNLDLKVLVPVSVRPQAALQPGHETLSPVGGAVGVIAPLPVMAMDPVARLYRIMGEMAGLKESRQAVAAEQLVRLAGFAPAGLHAVAARVASAEQRYNVALSNAPGPQSPRFVAGVRLEESYPCIPLVGDAALSVAVNSYDGDLFFGFLGDRDALFDIDVLAGFVPDAVAALREAARTAAVL